MSLPYAEWLFGTFCFCMALWPLHWAARADFAATHTPYTKGCVEAYESESALLCAWMRGATRANGVEDGVVSGELGQWWAGSDERASRFDGGRRRRRATVWCVREEERPAGSEQRAARDARGRAD